MVKDIVIFGAGQIGRMALTEYGARVAFFIDNNKEIQGKRINDIEIKCIEEILEEKEDYQVIIASKSQDLMERQLLDLGILNYKIYMEKKKYYFAMEELVFNPYLDNELRDVTESEWNENMKRDFVRETVNFRVEQMQGKEPIFDHVEIETINRCNGNCDFCPVSRHSDNREYKLMTKELFEDIINQLADINYAGKLALFSNNEPFLDEDILNKHKYAREKLPNAKMHLFTNGTLLKLEWFVEIMNYLDELVIDNYQQELKLIKPCEEIVRYCEKHPELKKRVTIVLRKPHEILSSRGGDAPNRKELISYGEDRCILPYKQLIIRPDGKVSLCCNDPLGKNTLGDLTKNSIINVWNNDRFKTVRNALLKGRKNWKHCEFCDAFNLG
ncbi:radical SAM protein [Lacrimispora celerecrescens]|uniref:radical SAM protein n=1 Tax=Lacrimispora celerecrescens TaxID=29354 RepID=UPI0016492F22|nr:radical SAM protein [Lacrimispora celerecrescens]